MALALYRTYRPGSLAEVIGQEHVTEPLARALESGRTHHAYLFSGPRGCGKTSTARILARSLNCEQGPTSQPCGTCRSCVELAPNGPGSMDVVELDAATHRGIDDARDLREKAIYAPAASRFKIYIIDEAHQLTNEAANALLKLVEEPPPHLRFIFATTEPDKIIPTIRSRTFHYGFRLVAARTLAEHLGSVCRSEGVPAETPALAIVARAGAGSVRDSLSVLGQLLAGAGPEGLTYADAISALGLTDTSLIDDFVAALSAGSAADMFGIVDTVISAGHDPRRFVTDILDRLRDLIILRADHEALAKGLIDVPDDEGQRMVGQAQSLGLAELSVAADRVSAGLGQIKGATAPRLQLELLCARLALPSPADDLSSVLARLDRLERGGATSPPAAASVPSGNDSARRRTAPVPVADESAAMGATGADQAGRRPELSPPTSGPPPRPGSSPAPGAPPRRPELRRDASAAGRASAVAEGDAPQVSFAAPPGTPDPSGAGDSGRAESRPVTAHAPAVALAPAEPAAATGTAPTGTASTGTAPPGRPRRSRQRAPVRHRPVTSRRSPGSGTRGRPSSIAWHPPAESPGPHSTPPARCRAPMGPWPWRSPSRGMSVRSPSAAMMSGCARPSSTSWPWISRSMCCTTPSRPDRHCPRGTGTRPPPRWGRPPQPCRGRRRRRDPRHRRPRAPPPGPRARLTWSGRLDPRHRGPTTPMSRVPTIRTSIPVAPRVWP